MIRPHPPRLRMKRRKTVSVTPAMGARTVAGEMVTLPMMSAAGTGCSGAAWRARAPAPHELSQNFFTLLFYLPAQNEAPAGARASIFRSVRIRVIYGLLLRSFGLRVLAAEALH